MERIPDPPLSSRDQEKTAFDTKVLGTVTEKTYAKIRTAILQGKRQPCDKLRLDLLHREYGVSINALRETLVRLASEGLVEVKGQKGFWVVPVSRGDCLEISELRELLEYSAVRKSIEAGSLEWEGRLAAAHHLLVRAGRLLTDGGAAQFAEWQKFDREFHIALMSACKSRWILRMHRQIYDQFMRYQYLAFTANDVRGEALDREHADLFECALNRDADSALAILVRHIQAEADVPLVGGLSTTSRKDQTEV